MDKYEYNLKLEEIDKLVDQGDYQEAAELADTIDWRRVRNVRTLCLISEIYEASGRLDDSKVLLVRAYKRSPVGRTVLYRLVEVTTKLEQYDEAMEFYSEYVQVAPHDNNRYILKYKIFKGRGSDIDSQIAILEEYLGQEYTERWAYELATLYQKSDQMQKCFAACDDLVLWFHSGKYVKKALELKMRYTSLTPKQQQIYEECLQEKAEEEALAAKEKEAEAEEQTVLQTPEPGDGEVLAEAIIAETEKEIADQITAHKEELDKAAEHDPNDLNEIKEAVSEKAKEAKTEVESEIASKEDSEFNFAEGLDIPKDIFPEKDAKTEKQETDAASEKEEQHEEPNLQIELAKTMRSIISGVVKRQEVNEEDIPASIEPIKQQTASIPKIQMPEATEQIAGQLSIDDILLSMSDQGRSVADAVLAEEEKEAAETVEEEQQTEEKEPEELVQEIPVEPIEVPEEPEAGKLEISRTVLQAAEEELTDVQREALQYTNHPEKLLKNKNSLPTYSEPSDEITDDTEQDDLGKTRTFENPREALKQAAEKEIIEGKTIRIPADEISAKLEEELQAQLAAAQAEGQIIEPVEDEMLGGEEAAPAAEADGAEAYPEEEYFDEPEGAEGRGAYLNIPKHLRGLFAGFTEVDGMEDQVANAIIQAEAKGHDRTSRTGNILIFGAHGSGKTTLAMNIAKAIAQDKGNQVMKIAKIYAADLNRKDIAATVAKIAGGTLIIEEAGDLEDGTVDQLTTAMEFRTDGLVVILEDEQQYVHELLMKHPRFTMKFTAQIYIPTYSVDELCGFAQIYAKANDYVIGAEGLETLKQKISATAENGNKDVSISDVVDMTAKAITRSNKFFRKMAMGKKRYDENDYVVLFPKDFAK